MASVQSITADSYSTPPFELDADDSSHTNNNTNNNDNDRRHKDILKPANPENLNPSEQTSAGADSATIHCASVDDGTGTAKVDASSTAVDAGTAVVGAVATGPGAAVDDAAFDDAVLDGATFDGAAFDSTAGAANANASQSEELSALPANQLQFHQRQQRPPQQRQSQAEFPDVFYDPTTGHLLQEPMVDEKGVSHEKQPPCPTIVLHHSNTNNNDKSHALYYPNRALQSLLPPPWVRNGLQQHQCFPDAALPSDNNNNNAWEFFVQLENDNETTTNKNDNAESATKLSAPLPEAFYCPITFDLMVDPCIGSDGYTYERNGIEDWIQVHACSPLTRTTMALDDLRPNQAIAALLELEKLRPVPHPKIQKWMTEFSSTTANNTNKANRRTWAAAHPASTNTNNNFFSVDVESLHRIETDATTAAAENSANQQTTRNNHNRCTRRRLILSLVVILVLIMLPYVPFGVFVCALGLLLCCVTVFDVDDDEDQD